MMSGRVWRLGFWTLLVFPGLLAGGSPRAEAATYNPETGDFRFTYTFANLPGVFGSTVGQVQRPTAEQQQVVRRLLGQVSQVLEQITDGRARIGRLDYVDNIRDADLVISLTGRPQSPGWAHKRAFDSPVGQIALYYQTLEPFVTQDVVFTVVHELCHYIFGLDDMYDRSMYPRGVPARPGPGSLMDNYFASARGYMGRMDNAEEWREAISPASRARSQGKSSQEIIEEFFATRGGPPRARGGGITTAEQAKATVVASAVAKTQEDLRREAEQGGLARARVFSGYRARTLARENLQRIIEQLNRCRAGQVVFCRDQLGRTIDLVGRVAGAVDLGRPETLSESVYEAIRERARTLGAEAASEPSAIRRQSTIRRGLQDFLRALINQGLVDHREFGRAPQRELIQQLVNQESLGAQERALTRLVGVTDLTSQLQLGIADDLIRVLDALDEPGIAERLDALRRIQEQLSEFGIPGRNFEQFGTRRSRFINPDPIDSRFDHVITQAGVFPYATIRDRGFEDFARLIESRRGRIELVIPAFQEIGGAAAPRLARIDRPGMAGDLDRFRREQRQVGLQTFLNEVISQLDRNRLENITVLVPPGGLPRSLGDRLRFLQADLRPGTDVRLDIVMVGPEGIEEELRSLAVSTGGAVLTVADIDEIGAIAQFLRNEQTQGSWVIIPQQGTISGRADDPEMDDLVKLAEALREETAAIRKIPGVGRLPDHFTRMFDLIDQNLQAIAGKNLEETRHLNFELLQRIGIVKDEFATILEQPEDLAPRPEPVAAEAEDPGPALPEPPDDEAGPGEPPAGRCPQQDREQVAGLIRQYERALEVALLKSGDDLPIYARINRREQEELRRRLEAQALAAPAGLNRPDLGPNRVRLARFWAEGEAEFELVVGLSRPLPAIPDRDRGELVPCPRPDLRLDDDLGAESIESAKVVFDADNSTETLLVYRVRYSEGVPGSGLRQGWYNPVLDLDPAAMQQIRDNRQEINFTFSIASRRPNIQLIAELVQELGPGQWRRGTLLRQEGPAIVRVQVAGPSPVREARMTAFVQRISRGACPIDTFAVPLLDDGEGQDDQADDGIYTAVIPLDGIEDDRPTEFRVFIQAETVDQGRYIALDTPANDEQQRESLEATAARGNSTRAVREATEQAEGRALRFQRATKLHFLVRP
ncbi:hypothetical protein BH23PLA1_BH23PLA1_16200 [soil metagenome]